MNFLEVSRELLEQGYSVQFRAPGTSMQPTILDGDRIMVQPVDLSEIRRGDIILYQSKFGVIAHRVEGMKKGNGEPPVFILRGDAMPAPDEPVPSSQVLGKVVYVERRGRHIDPYSLKAKLLRQIGVCSSRLKRSGIRSHITRLPIP